MRTGAPGKMFFGVNRPFLQERDVSDSVSCQSERMRITGKSIIGRVLEEHPKTAAIFHKYGLACVQCPVAASESIEQGALAHGIDEVKLKQLLHDLNKSIGVSKRRRVRKTRKK